MLKFCFFYGWLVGICFATQLQSQDHPLPFWDYRSTNTINVVFGIGYSFDNQNNGWYPFVDVEYSVLRDLFRQRHQQNHFYTWWGDFRLHGSFKIIRDLEKFDIRNDRREGRVSWTYETECGVMGDFLLRPVTQYYMDPKVDLLKKGSVLRVNYSLLDSGIRGPLRKLSNTNGRLTLGLRNVSDRWNFELYLQNDFWIWIFNKDIIKHDHGNTTEFGFHLHHRLDNPISSSSFFELDRNNTIGFDYWFQIITDRKVANTTSVAFARLGYYAVSDTTYRVFHGYSRWAVSFRSQIFKVAAGQMVDNLVRGRDLQRWAHQGTNHRNLKKRRNYLFAPNSMFDFEFAFYKDNHNSKKIYLKQLFLRTDRFHDLLISLEKIEQLTPRQLDRIMELYPDIEYGYRRQLFINKYRYKRSRTMEPTALFPWEANSEFYKSKKHSFYFKIGVYEQE